MESNFRNPVKILAVYTGPKSKAMKYEGKAVKFRHLPYQASFYKRAHCT
jgi:hypothetical protein